jgi:uncharacterized membrane protein
MLSGFIDGLKVIITSLIPYLELRGAIPLAWQLGFDPLEAYLLAVVGNMIPVIPIILLIDPISKLLSRISFFKHFFDWVFTRSQRKAPQIQKFGFWGLTVFVAIPLPMTGVWSGALIAFLLGIRKRVAFSSILLGVLIAGLIVTIITYSLANLFGN